MKPANNERSSQEWFTRIMRLTLIFGVLVLSGSVPVLGNERKGDAQAILMKMAEAYRTMATYADDGVVVTTHDTTGQIERQRFKIAFKRPHFFRFEWTDYSMIDSGTKSLLWWRGKEAFTYTEPDDYKTVPDLPLAIAGAVGVSGGAAQTVPRLLLVTVSGFVLTDLKDLRLLLGETFEGEDCYRVGGTHPRGGRYDLWISKKNHVLRKVRRRLNYMGFSSLQEEIHRNIKINTDLSESIFDLTRPTR